MAKECRRMIKLALLLLGALTCGYAAQAKIPRFRHVVLIVMENHSDASLIGNPDLLYLNRLVKKYGFDDNYFGVTHPSLPNYVAMLTGNIWGSHSDNPAQRFVHASLVGQMERAGLSWKAYMQSLPYAGYEGAFWPHNPHAALYVEKHDPFMVLPLVRKNPQLAKQVVPLRQLADDLSSGSLPNFAYIVPNVCHDMHGQARGPGRCSSNRKLMKAGSKFLRLWVPRIVHSRAWKHGDNVLFITWDESDHHTVFDAGGPDSPVLEPGAKDKTKGGVYGGGRVPLIVLWNKQSGPVRCHEWANHYSLLRTIEQSWHLPYLGYASDNKQVHALGCLFR